MSPSPADLTNQNSVASYAQSWGQLMDAVRGGASWSGGERNCCYLNLKGERFANASHLSGLDLEDDGRAMAICDWDRDGDLDLWLRNRTAPRLRLMLNRTRGGRSLALRLQGVDCNRDAVGAVVELRGAGAPIVRSVRAGEMFLSQSSKWLHFGLGEDGEAEEVIVRWPGGGEEIFREVVAGGRFLLRQGDGVAKAVLAPAGVELAMKLAPATQNTGGTRVVLPVAVPLLRIEYRDAAAKRAVLTADGRPRLLLLWESSCDTCGRDLAKLQAGRARLGSAGIAVLALAVDGIETAGAAYEVIDRTGFNAPWGFVDAGSLVAVWNWLAAMFDRRPDAAVPLGLLLDPAGQCVAIYRGEIDFEMLLEDSKRLIGIDPVTRWHLAPPLSGTWFTNPVGDGFVRRSIQSRMSAARDGRSTGSE